jgi:hypothetical protein
MVRTLSYCVLALVFVPAVALPALADYRERLVWRHSQGHFENTRGNTWVEKSPDGTFHFVERARREAFVELYDGSRDCTVRLFPNRCMVRFGTGPFEWYYDGHWER